MTTRVTVHESSHDVEVTVHSISEPERIEQHYVVWAGDVLDFYIHGDQAALISELAEDDEIQP